MIGKIALQNIIRKPLSSSLSIGLVAFGVGMISLMLIVQKQLDQKFDRDLKDIDLVVGAKGSPLQLVLSAIYHLDVPTGNIQLKEAEKIMQNPAVKQAIPLAYGDSYKGFRILGTTEDYPQKYEASIADGTFFTTSMQAVLGADVATKTGLKLGDQFLGTHGASQHGHVHDDHPYTVVGILEESNTVVDQLVLCNIESVWDVHAPHDGHEGHDHDGHEGHDHDGHEGHDHDGHEGHDHEGHDGHEGHDHDGHEGHEHDGHEDHSEDDEGKEITAILLEYKTKMAIHNMPRLINDQTNMQAVIPALEMNRLFYMLGIGADTIKWIAVGIILMAGFCMFFVLFNRLQARKYELALMRSVGYRPQQLFRLLIVEGIIISIIGYLLGVLISRVGLYFMNQQADKEFNFYFENTFMMSELWLLCAILLLGMLAAFLPAINAMRVDVSNTLSKP